MVNKYLKLAFIVCGVLSGLWLSCHSKKACDDLTWACDNDALLYFYTTLIILCPTLAMTAKSTSQNNFTIEH